MGTNQLSKKAVISLKISDFELPPMQDILIVGRKAQIGPEAARRMADALSPDQYTIIPTEHPKVEAVLIRTSLFDMLDRNVLLDLVLQEADGMFHDTMVLRSELKVSFSVEREVIF
ncbi:hypothetical protein [Paenibacillus cymbidii]|uniref:hypothetical protein n=1 Tax=Paenibacillus cymbidii TaxID=1639034 RepID=UPI00108188AC|nr:hypothetical protein [Paenibacillus cymbidii]